jgi:hypothetical protein
VDISNSRGVSIALAAMTKILALIVSVRVSFEVAL